MRIIDSSVLSIQVKFITWLIICNYTSIQSCLISYSELNILKFLSVKDYLYVIKKIGRIEKNRRKFALLVFIIKARLQTERFRT